MNVVIGELIWTGLDYKIEADWSFRDEFIRYWDDDVQLLTASIFAFRQILIKQGKVDPFRYITIACLAMTVYTNNHMPEKNHSWL